jgi:hypothetical protein
MRDIVQHRHVRLGAHHHDEYEMDRSMYVCELQKLKKVSKENESALSKHIKRTYKPNGTWNNRPDHQEGEKNKD